MYRRGITEFYIDEVHKYKDWSIILKNLVDEHDDLRIVYTGSSLLEIDNAKVDMSRRQTPYTLKGMSFREYMEYEGIIKMNAVPLEELLNNHVSIAMDIVAKTKILVAFESYLRTGVYPFYKDAGQDFLVNDKYLFEVGGEGKSFEQIADIPNSYLAIDGIETGYGARVPLWMFGLLY